MADFVAQKFLQSTECAKYGAVISFIGGKLQPIPFENIICIVLQKA